MQGDHVILQSCTSASVGKEFKKRWCFIAPAGCSDSVYCFMYTNNGKVNEKE